MSILMEIEQKCEGCKSYRYAVSMGKFCDICELDKKEMDPVFLHIAEEVWAMALLPEKYTLHQIAQKLEKDFTDLHNEWMSEADDYIHVDEAYQYICDNPPERGI